MAHNGFCNRKQLFTEMISKMKDVLFIQATSACCISKNSRQPQIVYAWGLITKTCSMSLVYLSPRTCVWERVLELLQREEVGAGWVGGGLQESWQEVQHCRGLCEYMHTWACVFMNVGWTREIICKSRRTDVASRLFWFSINKQTFQAHQKTEEIIIFAQSALYFTMTKMNSKTPCTTWYSKNVKDKCLLFSVNYRFHSSRHCV